MKIYLDRYGVKQIITQKYFVEKLKRRNEKALENVIWTLEFALQESKFEPGSLIATIRRKSWKQR